MNIPLFPNETVFVSAPANLMRGMEGVGGKIKVTNARILFEAHALNIQSQPEIIPIDQVVALEKRNTLGFIPNRLVVRTTYAEFIFITFKREVLINTIRQINPRIQA